MLQVYLNLLCSFFNKSQNCVKPNLSPTQSPGDKAPSRQRGLAGRSGKLRKTATNLKSRNYIGIFMW